MAFEVAEELVVVGGEVTDGVVNFGGGVQNGLGVVGEAGEVAAVFLGEEGFEVFAFFCVVELKGVIGAGGEEELARVVEVEGCDCGFGFGELEELGRVNRGRLGGGVRRVPLLALMYQLLPTSSV